jgi:hypothetical protein
MDSADFSPDQFPNYTIAHPSPLWSVIVEA